MPKITWICGRVELPVLCWKQSWQTKYLKWALKISGSHGGGIFLGMLLNKPLRLLLERWGLPIQLAKPSTQSRDLSSLVGFLLVLD